MRVWPFGTIEKKSLADPDDWLLELFGGAVFTNSGITVGIDDALRVPTVQSAIRVISEAAASLCIHVVAIDEATGIETPIRSHPVAALLDHPADWLGKFELIRGLVADALVRDTGGTAFVNWVDGKPVEIFRYIPGVIQVDLTQKTGEPIFRLNTVIQPQRNIIHLRNVFDRCPITLAREAIAVAIIMEKLAAKFFSRASRPGGVLETPKPLGDKGVAAMLRGWKAAQAGADNAGATPILWDGATFKAITFSSVDAQFLELRKFQVLEIANAFRVPPSMLWALDRATWSNAEQAGREFLVYCLEPWLQSLEGAFARALFLPEERGKFAVRFDRDDLTRADLGERATAYQSLVASRIINPNTARQWEGLPPYPDGETYANPNITVPVPAPAKPKDNPDAA